MKRKILSIAGFDPSGGAGILADIRTVEKIGCSGIAVITALTVQNSHQVFQVQAVDSEIVFEQIMRLIDDSHISAIKIGMLANQKIVRSVINAIRKIKKENISLPVVLDPVIRASSGYELINQAGLELVKNELFPLITVLTPNLAESEQLCGFKINSRETMEKTADEFMAMGLQSVVIKGGHLQGTADDLFQNQKQKKWFCGARIGHQDMHGTGCVFSAALTAYLAMNFEILEAVENAKNYLRNILMTL